MAIVICLHLSIQEEHIIDHTHATTWRVDLHTTYELT